MNILIPMAGAGSRFAKEGYKIHKPVIEITQRKTGKKVPMVVQATLDLPESKNSHTKIIYIDRDFHKKDLVEDKIHEFFPNAKFITIDYLTEGQASTCLLAKDLINNDEELIIGACDNGMVYDEEKFQKMKRESDVLVFTYRNNQAVLENPNAYGWIGVDKNDNVNLVSVKKPISNNPLNDHAVVATFWFKKGKYFVEAAKKMIVANDRINNEFYVDQTVKYCVEMGLKTKVFEISRYIGWGTPRDYENYENSFKYWKKFAEYEKL